MSNIIRRIPISSAPVANASSDRVPATLWLNIGYTIETPDGEKFVSLPVGIPVDQIQPVKTASSNADWAEFQAARNDLIDQLIALGGGLEAGKDMPVNLETRLRRVNEESKAPVSNGANPYIRSIV